MTGTNPDFVASQAAGAVRDASGLDIMLASAQDDGEGGVFIQVGYAGLALEDAEYVAATILRDIRKQMAENQDPGHCEACARAFARVTAAIAALEIDGARPTGRVRGSAH